MQTIVRSVLLIAFIANSASMGFAQTSRRGAAPGIDTTIFEETGILTDKLTMHRPSVMVLEAMLASLRKVDSATMSRLGLYSTPGTGEIPKGIDISTAQVLSLLSILTKKEHPALWSALEDLKAELDENLAKAPKITAAVVGPVYKKLLVQEGSAVQRLDIYFKKVSATAGWDKVVAQLSPARAYEVNREGNKVVEAGYEDIRMYVNHTYINPKYLYKNGVPFQLTDEQFSQVCEKISHSEALAKKVMPYYYPGTDFAFKCRVPDFLNRGTNLVRVLRSFIGGVGELNRPKAMDFENTETIKTDLETLGLDEGASEEVWFNVFEFNLDEVRDSFMKNHTKNMDRFRDAFLKEKDKKKFQMPVPKLRGGIHHEYATAKFPRVFAIYNAFQEYAAAVTKEYSKTPGLTKELKQEIADSVQVFSVPISGLNHQKIVIRDPSNPKKAAVLFLSGNFTNSCLGPFGDEGHDIGDLGVSEHKINAINAKDGRTLDQLEGAVPNANHAIIVKGFLPAQVTRLELMKILKKDRIKGKDQIPNVGNYRIYKDAGNLTESSPYIDITFSMKGGMGTPDRDILVPLIQKEADRVSVGKKSGGAMVESMHFVASSPSVNRALLRLAAQSNKDAGGYQFRFLGDTPFSMREYSIIQQLSCVTRRMERRALTPKDIEKARKLEKELTIPYAPKEFYDISLGKTEKEYFADLPAELRKRSKIHLETCPAMEKISYTGGSGPAIKDEQQLREVRASMRIAPTAYSENSYKIGKTGIKYNGKIHHKVLLFPYLDLGTVGSSFNISNGANGNHEQLTVLKDRGAVGTMRGAIAFMHLFSPVSRAKSKAETCTAYRTVKGELKELKGVHDGSVFCNATERNIRLANKERCSAEALKALPKDEAEARHEDCLADLAADEKDDDEADDN